jgi:tetratricopeptide (TPR) repeat protein
MSHSEPKALIRARKLIEEAKFEEALQIVNKFGKKKELSSSEQISYYTLKSLLATIVFNNKLECLEYAEKAYQASLKQENSLQLLDVYIQMAISSLWHYKINEAKDFIVKSENLLKILPQELSTELKKREAYILWQKGYISSQEGNLEKAREYAESALALRKELDIKVGIFYSLLQLCIISKFEGNLDMALEYIESSKNLADSLKNIQLNQYSYAHLGVIYAMKGELDLALSYNEKILAIAKEKNDRITIANMLNNNGMIYQEKGDFDRALNYLEKSIAIKEEICKNDEIFGVADTIFHLALDRKDFEQAKRYLNRMEQIADQEKKNLRINLAYRIDRAVYLKHSPRALNRGKAEEILKNLIEEGIPDYEFLKIALLNLCDLLLFELSATREPEILEELQFYISQLFDTVKKGRSYSLLAETYLLQTRLALITLNMKKARQLLTKAQKIAGKYGLKRLAMRISHEHDQLLNQLDLWENIRISKAPLNERIELARLNDQMVQMLRKRMVEPPKPEAEQPVLFAIMTKEGDMVLSSPFTADMTIDEAQFAEFLSSCNTFCDQIFSESFDRVKFGQYTILITAVDPFCVYYMFQGHSYSAQQKLTHFSETFSKNPTIMDMLEKNVDENKVIAINEHPSLEELIVESFLSDPQKFQMPFKAYEGNKPFIFVSYSHTDKLQVYPIIDYLNKKGIHIWYDEGIPVSENWKKSVVENLERCKAFLLFITPHILDSDYVRKEISFASKRNKPFFGVYLKETELPSELEFDIADIQSMKKYLMPDSEFYPKLQQVIYPALYEHKII